MSKGKRKQRRQEQAIRKSERDKEQAQRKANDSWYDKRQGQISKRESLAETYLRQTLSGNGIRVSKESLRYHDLEFGYSAISGDGHLVAISLGSSGDEFNFSNPGELKRFINFCDTAITKKREEDARKAAQSKSYGYPSWGASYRRRPIYDD